MGFVVKSLVLLTLLFVAGATSGCYTLSLDPNYRGPSERPAELDQYYSKGSSYQSFNEEVVGEHKKYTLKRLLVGSDAGLITIDYFQRKKKSENLVLVFPVLGGKKNMIENYFAHYFAIHGYDAAIVHRHDDFKNPDNFEQIEELFRRNVVRDRIALDFFEVQYGKKNFASFGISRGAINVAMTAGVEPRLKYNVLALGGSDMVGVFKHSDQRRIGTYREAVMARKKITEDEFYAGLEHMLRTDPKYLSQHMDARNTLLILSVFDSTVPYKNGRKLRRQIGNPETIFLTANHYTSLLYTQLVKVFPPTEPTCVFPMDYVEGQAKEFYDKNLKQKNTSFRNLPIKILKAPFDLIGGILEALF